MTELLVVLVSALVVIAAAAVLGPRLRIASPLVLVVIGVLASLLPMFTSVQIEPEWILEGVLPPLLYSSAVSLPTMNFRREFASISVLSVVLVIGSALLLGLFFVLVLPDLGFAWGVALGAIVSPTDAVATSIVKKTSASKRSVAILDGESLLNDATALVVLRSAIAAAGLGFSFLGALGTFAYSVAIALVFGWLVGWLNLEVRKRVKDPTVNTVLSFAVPFAASVPATFLGASGLVAAVVAGLITGILAPRYLSPQNRVSDTQNWGTVSLVLEGAVFLTMGLQLTSVVADVETEHAGVASGVLIATGALALLLVVRAAFIGPLLLLLRALTKRGVALQDRLTVMEGRGDTAEGKRANFEEMNQGPGRRRKATDRDVERFAVRVTRGLADIAYFRRDLLGWRDGTVLVWAGIRGAVTVAAAQTLPADTPQRPTLVLIAYAVAALSLVVQGASMSPIARLLSPPTDAAAEQEQSDADTTRLMELLRSTSEAIPHPDRNDDEPRHAQFQAEKDYRVAVLQAQRTALLDARDNGTFDADLLTTMLADLDASQIAIQMRGGGTP